MSALKRWLYYLWPAVPGTIYLYLSHEDLWTKGLHWVLMYGLAYLVQTLYVVILITESRSNWQEYQVAKKYTVIFWTGFVIASLLLGGISYFAVSLYGTFGGWLEVKVIHKADYEELFKK